MIIVINSDNNSNYPCAPRTYPSSSVRVCHARVSVSYVYLYIRACTCYPYRLIVLIITYAECLTCFTRDAK